MRLALPFWVWFIYLDVKFWFLAVPATLALMLRWAPCAGSRPAVIPNADALRKINLAEQYGRDMNKPIARITVHAAETYLQSSESLILARITRLPIRFCASSASSLARETRRQPRFKRRSAKSKTGLQTPSFRMLRRRLRDLTLRRQPNSSEVQSRTSSTR
jgi:hypothetical protein